MLSAEDKTLGSHGAGVGSSLPQTQGLTISKKFVIFGKLILFSERKQFKSRREVVSFWKGKNVGHGSGSETF